MTPSTLVIILFDDSDPPGQIKGVKVIPPDLSLNSDVKVCQQRLSSAFDFPFELPLNSPPNNTLLANLDSIENKYSKMVIPYIILFHLSISVLIAIM